MVIGCSRPSCTYRLFWRVNISNVVHSMISLIPNYRAMIQ
uniref:Ribosomal protein S14 n=1 Tax=Cistanche salsa TaxID=161396 RepID=A0A6G9IFI4_CISSA|nr:ribosomal protein S14 [Cistanche salsa]